MSPKSGQNTCIIGIKDFFHTGRLIKDRQVFADNGADIFKCRMVSKLNTILLLL